VTWLTRQLSTAPDDTRLEAYAKNVRVPIAAELATVVEEPSALFGADKRAPVRYRVAVQKPMGVNRKSGRSPGFVDSVLDAIAAFYEDVLQNLTPFQRAAPKRKAPPAVEPTLAVPVERVTEVADPDNDSGFQSTPSFEHDSPEAQQSRSDLGHRG
jgi:hypothetical protein